MNERYKRQCKALERHLKWIPVEEATDHDIANCMFGREKEGELIWNGNEGIGDFNREGKRVTVSDGGCGCCAYVLNIKEIAFFQEEDL